MFRFKNLPAHFLSSISPGNRFRLKAEYHGDPEHILVLNRPPSSTIDIYIRPRLQNCPLPVTYVDYPKTNPDPEIFKQKTFVIISRYINDPWCDVITEYRRNITGVSYLMDDNIPEAGFDHSLPPGYALGLARFFQKYWKRLQNICSELWVCSGHLAEIFDSPTTSIIEPLFISRTRTETADRQKLTIFYHAQMPHYQDNLWLRDVINHIQTKFSHTTFETFGGDKVKKAYLSVPRTIVLDRFKWKEYLDYCAGLNHDVGLAPINAGIFNNARSMNKIFDITRCGGAGIYTDTEPYTSVVQHAKTGILCPHNRSDWIDAISELIENEHLRKNIYDNSLAFCEQHNVNAKTPPSLTKLINGS